MLGPQELDFQDQLDQKGSLVPLDHQDHQGHQESPD